ncbi:hypothetical protein P0D71_04955 [Paraburkholderia sp. RL17-383-BIF-A]|uniref:hypothetical protein n=1 Tax=Paraburkholderia sp. RL17-383-BIF-A TaxID=3031631 RepID=UPI0038BA936E
MNTNQNEGIAQVQAARPAASPVADQASEPAPSNDVKVVLRYGTEIREVDGCPPQGVQGLDIVGFRFAFGDIKHAHNWLPVAKIQPERTHAGQPITQCCTGYSLSVFESLDALTRKAKKVLATSPKFLKNVGDHFIALKISSADGVCTLPNTTGHFDFFEFQSFSGTEAVAEHARLPL